MNKSFFHSGWLRSKGTGHRRIARAALDNAGRSFAEPYSGAAFAARRRAAKVSGPGLPILEEAASARRPVMLVTGHFGNVHAARARARAQGHEMAGLYQPMRDARFNAHYAAALQSIGPMYPQGPRGYREMVRLLRRGGVVGALLDVHVAEGVPLRFFGRPAWTSLAMVDLALRTDAVVLPAWSLRAADGLSFDIRFEAPIPTDSPAVTMQTFNDRLEKM